MDSLLNEKIQDKYHVLFKSNPECVVFAPGRVNLIGEHTDYSEGFVFPVAINMGISVAFSPSDDGQVKLYSLDFDDYLDQRITDFTRGEDNWKEYVKGVAWALNGSGFELKGFRGVFAGNLPIGAGLSSSAALELAIAKAFCFVNDIEVSNTELAKICRRAEREWVGVNVGIMDQLISAKGKSGHALKLDCRTLQTEYLLIPKNICFVVMDTNTRRELSHSEYNTRHQEVEKAASILGVNYLRDATKKALENNRDQMPPLIYRRAKHVITENERVNAFGKAIRDSDLEKMGDLLNASHKSLRNDFEVSSRELDTVVALSQIQVCCYGARMTGAGFGGCALALVDEDKLDYFTKNVKEQYTEKTGIDPNIFKVESSDGVHAVN